MAKYTSAQAKDFIAQIGPLIKAEAKKRGYKTCSAVIAQAICESAANQSLLGYKYHNYFGLKCGKAWKGASVNLSTKEEYKVGTLTTIKDNFRAFDSMEDGVKGYFDFIATARYANLKYALTPKDYLNMIKSDGYATSSTYVNTNLSIISKYGLEKFDEGMVENVTYYPKYTGTSTSIVVALEAVGETDMSKEHRTAIANANGIKDYRRTAEENLRLVGLLKEGRLIRC